jgi:hypothetical protein
MKYKKTDKNGKIKILGISEDKGVSEDLIIDILNDEDIIKINNALESGLEVFVENGNIITGKTEYFYDVPLDKPEKVQEMRDARDFIKTRIQDYDMIDFICYMDAAFELAANGYFITDSNKEEKYLEILEAGDEHQIDLLETYLNLKDKISRLKNIKQTYDKKVEKILEDI